ncbi:MAG: hypothetical protein AB7I25_00705 [Vicinamibacterales bacterium]
MKGRALALALVASAAGLAGCGEVARSGRAPAMLVINTIEAASGARPTAFGGTLDSDVITNVRQTGGDPVPTIFSDVGRATFRLVLKDPGVPGGAASPSSLNQVTVTRYQVTFRRSDGRNTPGVDVPHPFDSAVTATVPADGTVTTTFELVRHSAKQEAPLANLRTSSVIIATVADITFTGRDLAGNTVVATGSIGVQFGNFGDPQ